MLLVGGEGGGSEREEEEDFSFSVSPACCGLQNERSCVPLCLRGNCCFFLFLFFLLFPSIQLPDISRSHCRFVSLFLTVLFRPLSHSCA